jgi:hypothetical protein
VTPYAGEFNEPSIAVNPHNPKQIAAAFQNNVTVAYSQDAGLNWSLATGTAPPNYKVAGDVSLVYDSRGHAIVCYIAFDQWGTPSYWALHANRDGIFVRRSLDGGNKWEERDKAIIEHPPQTGNWEDKPYIVADNTQGPYAGNLYVGWTQYRLTKSVILISRSTDGGETWSTPTEISTHAGSPRGDGGGAVIGFDGAVAPDGTLYAVWADGNGIAFTSSPDGGRSFAASRKIIDTTPLAFHVVDASGANGFPQIGVDQGSGRIYVTWSDFRNGDIDVFCSTSTDKGNNWTPAVRVNTDPVHNGIDQFYQWLAVDPQTGAAYVVFYDRRYDSENHNAIIVLAQSVDGGQSFVNYAWTQTPFDPKGVKLGDYTALAAFGGRVYGAWAEKPVSDWLQAWAKLGLSAQFVAVPQGTTVRVGIAQFGK